VAGQADGQWRAIVPKQVRVDYSSPAARADAGRRLAAMWQRIWQEPAAAPGAADHTAVH